MLDPAIPGLLRPSEHLLDPTIPGRLRAAEQLLEQMRPLLGLHAELPVVIDKVIPDGLVISANLSSIDGPVTLWGDVTFDGGGSATFSGDVTFDGPTVTLASSTFDVAGGTTSVTGGSLALTNVTQTASGGSQALSNVTATSTGGSTSFGSQTVTFGGNGTSGPALNITAQSDPSSPSNGDLWADSSGYLHWWRGGGGYVLPLIPAGALGTPGYVLKWVTATTPGDSTATDDGSCFKVTKQFQTSKGTKAPGATENNLDPGDVVMLMLAPPADSELTGLQGGTPGRLQFLFNVGPGLQTLTHQDVRSTPGNQFVCPDPDGYVLPVGAGVPAQYDPDGGGYYRVMGGLSGPAGTQNRVLRYTGSGGMVVGDSTAEDDGTTFSLLKRLLLTAPATLTPAASQNDYDVGDYSYVILAPTANISITGLANGAKGRAAVLANYSSKTITLPDFDAGSAANNQFDNPGGMDLVLRPFQLALVIHNGNTWQVHTDLCPLTAKGDLYAYDGSKPVALAAGTDGHLLQADSGAAEGLSWLDPTTLTGSSLPGASGPLAFGAAPTLTGVPQWFVWSVSHTDLQAASTNNKAVLFTLPAGACIHEGYLNHRTQFAGTGITNYVMSLGNSVSSIFWITTRQVSVAVNDNGTLGGPFSTQGTAIPSYTGTTDLYVWATSTGANLDQSTAGVLRVALLLSQTVP